MAGKHTVFVLGAGSSVGTGYPPGAELTSLLRNCGVQLSSKRTGVAPDVWNQFERAFAGSGQRSIDAWLAKRPEMATVGKKAIAALLISRQYPAKLVKNNKDAWQLWLVSQLTRAPWDELSFGDFAVVTFNYDVSFEVILVDALVQTYSRSRREVLEKLRTLRIVHVYGALGNVLDEHYPWPYDHEITPERVEAAASSIKVIPEGRDDDATLMDARSLLATAAQIAFLGFGFDELNLTRLDASTTCSPQVVGPHGVLHRRIVGSCLDMTPAEARAAFRAIGLPAHTWGANHRGGLGDFYPVECLQLLRETLVYPTSSP